MKSYLKNNKYTLVCAGALYLLSIFGCAMIFVRRLYTGKYTFLFLIWNLFLAWIPFFLSVLTDAVSHSKNKSIKTIFSIVLFPLWAVFFPNAPYMVTDFIHFRNNGTFLIWYDLVIYLIFIWTGFFLGFLSFHIEKKAVDRIVNKYLSWMIMSAVLLLSSYAIYIGRFVRHNSWDAIVSPFIVFRSFVSNVNFQSMIFSFIFSVFLFLVYSLAYGMLGLEKRYNAGKN